VHAATFLIRYSTADSVAEIGSMSASVE